MTSMGARERETVVLGIPFSRLTNQETIARIDRMIVERSTNIIVTANLDSTVRAMKDPILKRIMYSAALVTPDGMPLVWAGRTMKPPLTERVAGSDFIPMLIEHGAKKGYSFFFLGGREEVAQLAAKKCKDKFPALKIAGVYSPPFGTVWEMDNDRIVEQVNASGADILIVAFGAPKQEYWMAMNHYRLNVPVSIGVGATIDFLSGSVPRAPEWMKKLSAEWLFRWYLEPRRLTGRYVQDVIHGLVPLLKQTVVDNALKAFSNNRSSNHTALASSDVTVESISGSTVRALLVEINHGHQLAFLAEHFESYFCEEHDALILDLRSSVNLDSEALSIIVAIDKSVRKQAKYCIVVLGAKSRFVLRSAKLHTILAHVPTTEHALRRLRQFGSRAFSVSETIVDRHMHIATLYGELTNDTAFLIEELRPIFMRRVPVILDLSSLAWMDCGGLYRLLCLWSDIRGPEEQIHCITVNPSYVKILNSGGLDRRFVVHSTLTHASEVATHLQFAFEPAIETAKA